MCVHIHICMYTCISIYTYLYIYIYTHVCVHMHIVHIGIHMSTYLLTARAPQKLSEIVCIFPTKHDESPKQAKHQHPPKNYQKSKND